MKLTELQTKVKGWGGMGIAGMDTTGKELLLTYCGMFVSPERKEIFLAIKVGQKIYDCVENDLELNDEEYAFLEKAIEEPRHIAIAMAQIYKCMGITE